MTQHFQFGSVTKVLGPTGTVSYERSEMKPETVLGYRAQLKRGEPLDIDQQRALVNALVATQNERSGGRSAQQAEQAIRERENDVKDALADIAAVVEEGVTFAHLNSTTGSISTLPIFSQIQDYVAAAQQMLRSRKGKHTQSWADWKVMVDHDHGKETHDA